MLAEKAVAAKEAAEGESEGVERGTEKEERNERALKGREFRKVLGEWGCVSNLIHYSPQLLHSMINQIQKKPRIKPTEKIRKEL